MVLGSQGDAEMIDMSRQSDQSMSRMTQSLFQDPYFRALFEKRMPQAGLFAQKAEGVPQEQLSVLLKDLASALSTQKTQKEEFIMICLLNALFGNPNIHLV